MTDRLDVRFVDSIGQLRAPTDEQSRRLNARLDEAARACGDVAFDGTVIRIELYHLREFGAGNRVDWHRHPFTELTWVEGGAITYEHGDQAITLRDGEVFLMPAFAPHRWQVVAGTALHGFMLTVRPATDRQRSLVPQLSAAAAELGYRLRPEPVATAALRQAEQEALRGDALGYEAAAGFLRAGLARLARQVVAAVPAGAVPVDRADRAVPPAPLERAVAFMAEHLAEPLDVPTVARHVHLSTRQLDRIFNAAFDMPTGAFLLHTRLERARYLLGDSDLSVKQIALACGFTDPNYFGRIFRKRHGQSPGAYRRGQERG